MTIDSTKKIKLDENTWIEKTDDGEILIRCKIVAPLTIDHTVKIPETTLMDLLREIKGEV